MEQPVKVTAFLNDFQDYLKSRGIDQASIDAIRSIYIEIDANPDLVKKLLAKKAPANVDWQSLSPFSMSDPDTLDNISYPNLVYLYLNAILNGDIEKAEQFWVLADYYLDYRQDPAIVNAYYRVRLALAYDYETKQFNTDRLLLNTTRLIKEKKDVKIVCLFYPDICPCYNNAQFPQYDYADYLVENAIRFITSLITNEKESQEKKEKESQKKNVLSQKVNYSQTFFSSLPLRLIFSHPQQDNSTYENGMYLLSIGVTPRNILNWSKRNVSNDYRLLNHCVELIAAALNAELFEVSDNDKMYTLYRNHPYIPAAKLYSGLCDPITAAASTNYKPAIAYLLRFIDHENYQVLIKVLMDQLLLLWQEKFLSTAETFRVIARDLAEDSKHQSSLEFPYMTCPQSNSETAQINH